MIQRKVYKIESGISLAGSSVTAEASDQRVLEGNAKTQTFASALPKRRVTLHSTQIRISSSPNSCDHLARSSLDGDAKRHCSPYLCCRRPKIALCMQNPMFTGPFKPNCRRQPADGEMKWLDWMLSGIRTAKAFKRGGETLPCGNSILRCRSWPRNPGCQLAHELPIKLRDKLRDIAQLRDSATGNWVSGSETSSSSSSSPPDLVVHYEFWGRARGVLFWARVALLMGTWGTFLAYKVSAERPAW
jgi:hypothetical protein